MKTSRHHLFNNHASIIHPCAFCHKTACVRQGALCRKCKKLDPPVESSYPSLGTWVGKTFVPFLPAPIHQLTQAPLRDWARSQMINDVRSQDWINLQRLHYGPNAIVPKMWPEHKIKWAEVTDLNQSQKNVSFQEMRRALQIAVMKRLMIYGLDVDSHVLPGGRLPQHQADLYPIQKLNRVRKAKGVPLREMLKARMTPVCQHPCSHRTCAAVKTVRKEYKALSNDLSICYRCQWHVVQKCPCREVLFCSSKCRYLSVGDHLCFSLGSN